MAVSTLKSTHLTNAVQGHNSVMFDFQGRTFFYERLGNSIHEGSRGRLGELARLVDSVDYSPPFEANTMISDLTGKIATLVIGTTELCNLNCSYCLNSPLYPHERPKSGRSMHWDVAKRAIDLFLQDAHPSPTIQFYGGEATLNWALVHRCVEYVLSKNRDVKFGITTNGTNLRKIAADLVGYDMRVTVSLDGPKPIHDKYRRTTGDEPTYDNIMNGVDYVRSLKNDFVKTNFTLSATCWDLADFPQIVDYFIELNYNFAHMFVGFVETRGLLSSARMNHSSSLGITDEYLGYGFQYIGSVARGRQPAVVLQSLFDKALHALCTLSEDKMPPALSLRGTCLPGEFSVFVDVSGGLYICEKLIGGLPLGNVYMGIDSEEQRRAVRYLQAARNRNCCDCWAARLCHPCIAVVERSADDALSFGDKCRAYRDSKLMQLALFGELLYRDSERRYISYFERTNVQ